MPEDKKNLGNGPQLPNKFIINGTVTGRIQCPKFKRQVFLLKVGVECNAYINRQCADVEMGMFYVSVFCLRAPQVGKGSLLRWASEDISIISIISCHWEGAGIPHGIQGSTNHTQSISWQLMTWWQKEPDNSRHAIDLVLGNIKVATNYYCNAVKGNSFLLEVGYHDFSYKIWIFNYTSVTTTHIIMIS